MKQLRKIDVLVYFLAGILVLLVLFIGLQFLFAERGYWEVEVGNEGPHLALTLRLAGCESDNNQSRRIVFQDIEASAVESGTFQLPDEADLMSGTRLTFQDITLRPGRVTFELQGHEIDIMVRGISIDGVPCGWEEPAPIEIVD